MSWPAADVGPRTVRGRLAEPLWLLEVLGLARAGGDWRSRWVALAEPGCITRLGRGRCMPAPPVPGRPARPMAPATGGGDGEPGSASAPARRKLMFRPESWRELAGGSWSRWDLWFCTVAVPGFDGDWARLSDEIMRRSPRALVRSGLGGQAQPSGGPVHARLAAVNQDAGQLAGEATRDLVEALLWSLAAELRGSGFWLPRRGRHGPGGLPAGRHRRAPGLRPVDAHRHAGRTALAAGRRDLALEVYAAANRPGLQQDCLAGRCLELTSQPPPRRHLRAVQ